MCPKNLFQRLLLYATNNDTIIYCVTVLEQERTRCNGLGENKDGSNHNINSANMCLKIFNFKVSSDLQCQLLPIIKFSGAKCSQKCNQLRWHIKPSSSSYFNGRLFWSSRTATLKYKLILAPFNKRVHHLTHPCPFNSMESAVSMELYP